MTNIKIVNGEEVEMTAEEIAARVTEEAAAAARDIEDYKEVYYGQRLDGGIEVGGMPVKSHEQSRGLINGAVTRALIESDPDAVHDFFAPDGSAIPLTNAQFIAVGLALSAHVQKALAARRATAGTVYATRAEFEAAWETAYSSAS